MKNILFFLLILCVFIFANCKKEENKPSHNQLVIVDKNGNTTISKPSNTSISGSFDPSFGVAANSGLTNDYNFSMGTFKGYAPSSVTFTSMYPYEIKMRLSSTTTGAWVSTAGTAYIESKSGSALLDNGGTKYMKITFNNIQFTREANYMNPNPPADTIWVSGIINAYRK